MSLPRAIVGAIKYPALSIFDFRPTKYHNSADKAWFGNYLLAFVADYCPEHRFTDKFYLRLSNCFGHIAHYSKAGFIGEYFTSAEDKHRFLKDTMRHPCFGDPNWTFSDVERAVIVRLQRADVLPIYAHLAGQETEQQERAHLAQLAAKYGCGSTAGPGVATPHTQTGIRSTPCPINGDLFAAWPGLPIGITRSALRPSRPTITSSRRFPWNYAPSIPARSNPTLTLSTLLLTTPSLETVSWPPL